MNGTCILTCNDMFHYCSKMFLYMYTSGETLNKILNLHILEFIREYRKTTVSDILKRKDEYKGIYVENRTSKRKRHDTGSKYGELNDLVY